jgi:hypothetical protein
MVVIQPILNIKLAVEAAAEAKGPGAADVVGNAATGGGSTALNVLYGIVKLIMAAKAVIADIATAIMEGPSTVRVIRPILAVISLIATLFVAGASLFRR